MALLRKDACILDIQGKVSSMMVKKVLLPLAGKRVKIKYNLGRNKYEEFDGTIIKIYNSLFLVKDNNSVKSFSFADVVTKIIKIYV